ncbi:Os08g0230450 [Oryza sativa Japonica Group]|uniref:Os08g0230450 protein n=1 Tax=Oryza sativa subsp. japonica TaxID=39947 RepID=C7J670_ORYSJ|nr:Os08g0230450 [Oryza sativa Japonica Group]|eukprot:NP_001175446.1 Os08g0230450 [Oryza sativa Japonica Group]
MPSLTPPRTPHLVQPIFGNATASTRNTVALWTPLLRLCSSPGFHKAWGYTVDDDRSSRAVAEPVHRRQDFAEPHLLLGEITPEEDDFDGEVSFF